VLEGHREHFSAFSAAHGHDDDQEGVGYDDITDGTASHNVHFLQCSGIEMCME
jgi:hypothetical protein